MGNVLVQGGGLLINITLCQSKWLKQQATLNFRRMSKWCNYYHYLRAFLETFDHWDILSEWWEDMTMTKTITKTKQRQTGWQWGYKIRLFWCHDYFWTLLILIIYLKRLRMESNLFLVTLVEIGEEERGCRSL